EPVQLEIDVHRMAGPVASGNRGGESPVGGEADAVGVDDDCLDGAGLRGINGLEDLVLNGGLSTGETHDFWFTLGGGEGVEHPLALGHRDGVAVGVVAGIGETDRAVQVAVTIDLDQPQAGVLFVIWAQPAVAGTAVSDLGLKLEWDGTGLVEPRRIHVHLSVAVHQGLELAVLAAALAQIHLVVADVYFGIYHYLAHGADALGVLDEH